jgi:hypothetical protein
VTGSFGDSGNDAAISPTMLCRAAFLSLACVTALPTTSHAATGDALPAGLRASEGKTFYVSTSGSNSNPGSASAPWRTIQKAVNTLRPGERVLVRSGTYTENLEMRRAGNASAPITVAAQPGDRPVLRAAGGHPLEVGPSAAYFRFSGFVITGHRGTSGGNVDVYGDHVEISGNEIRGGRDQGIYTAEESSAVQILGNRIHHNGRGIEHQSHGIYLQGDDHLVANNAIHDHPEGFGIQVYDEGSRSIVVHNTVVRSGHSGIVVGGEGGVDHVTMRNNIFAFNAKWGIQHDSDCPRDTKADHNVLYGNRNGGVQGGCRGLDTSGGNRSANPRFRSLARRDLHLRGGSPAIGAALSEWTPAVDRDGDRRPRGGRPDAGAHEDG